MSSSFLSHRDQNGTDRHGRDFRLAYTPIVNRCKPQDQEPPKLVAESATKQLAPKATPKARWAAQARVSEEAMGIRSAPGFVDLTTDARLVDDDRKIQADSMIGHVGLCYDPHKMVAGIDESLPFINQNCETWDAYKRKRNIWMDDNIAMICHVDFGTYLLHAMQVKEITDAIGRGSIVSPAVLLATLDAQEAASNTERIQRAQLPPGMDMPPVCQRRNFPWVDSLMDYLLETLDCQVQHLHQYYDSVKPQLQLQKEENEQKRRQAEAVATKYPFRQTSYLTEWIVDQAHTPYASPEEIEKLSMGSGLSALQVTHWITNVRKRNQNATVVRGKKPAGYLDYAFIAASRDCDRVEARRGQQKVVQPTLDSEDRKLEEEESRPYLAPKRHIRNVEADGVSVTDFDFYQLADIRRPPAKMEHVTPLRIKVPNPGSLTWSGQSVAKDEDSALIRSNCTPSRIFLPAEVTSCELQHPATDNQRKRPASTNVSTLPTKRSRAADHVSRSTFDRTPGTNVAPNRKDARPYHQDDQELGAALHLSASEVIDGDLNRLAQAQLPPQSITNLLSCAILPTPAKSLTAVEPKSLLTKLSEGNETLLDLLSTQWFHRHQTEGSLESNTWDVEGNSDD